MAEKIHNGISDPDWDPMKEDYQDSSFNCYMSRSGVNLASQKGDSGVAIYVSGIPSSLTEEALRSMFSQAGKVISVSNLKNREDADDSYGFVRMETVQAAEQAIQMFDKWPLSGGKHQLHVDIAHSTEYKNTSAPNVINESIIPRSETDQVMRHSMSSSTSSILIIRSCTVCQKQAHKQCQRCKIPYCSQECQQQDWPEHKKICPSTRTVVKEVVHHTQNSRMPVCSPDSEFDKRFDISIGEEFASLVTEVLTKDTNLADDVSKIIVHNEKAKELESLSHQHVKTRTQESGNVKSVELLKHSDVILMSFINPLDFWVVPVTSLPQLAQLQEKLNKFYMNTSPDDSFSPAQGDLCAGQFSVDKNWYRCRIDCMLANTGEVAVSYVDYGNAEIIPISSIRVLHSHFADLHEQAVHCSLYGIKPTDGRWSVDALKYASAIMPENKTLSITVKEQEETSTVVDVTTPDGHSVAELLVAKGLAQSITRKMQENTDVRPNKLDGEVCCAEKALSQNEKKFIQQHMSNMDKSSQPVTSVEHELSFYKQSGATPVITKVLDSLKVDDLITIEIKVTKSPSEFWAHVVSEHNMKGLTLLTSELNSYYSQLEINTDFVPSPTDLFACYCLADKQCYRAELRRISNKLLDVFYVDYGKMDVVTQSVVHPLLPSHYALPLQALPCSLAGICGTKSDGSWEQEAIDLFLRNSAQKMAVRMMSKDAKCCQVSVILPDGSTLNDLLIEKQLAFPVPGHTQMKQKEPPTDAHIGVKDLPVLSDPVNDVLVNVVYAPNVNNIAVQLMSQEYIDQYMAVHQVMANFKPSVSSFQPMDGDLVAAKYSLDGKWYRAEVKKVLSSLKFHVYFIDYGNEEELSKISIAPLPENMFKYPVFAIRCSLAGIKGASSWDPKLLENQVFKMTVADLAVSEKLTVELYNNKTGRSIKDQLVEMGFAVRDVELMSDGTYITQPSVDKLEGNMDFSYSVSGRSIKCIMSADVPYQPVDSDQLSAVAVYYLNSAEFYIVGNNPEVLAAARNMGAELQAAYSNNTSMTDARAKYQPVKGELVAVYCVPDKCWYRAEVLKNGMTEVEVLYTEYGNIESVSAWQVRHLMPQFSELPKQALKCTLKKELAVLDEVKLCKAIENKNLTYKLHNSRASEGHFTVLDIMLPDSMTSVISQMIKCGAAEMKELGTTPSPASNLESAATFIHGEEVINGQRCQGDEKDAGAWIRPCHEENLDTKKLLEENVQLRKELKELRQQLSQIQMMMKEHSSG